MMKGVLRGEEVTAEEQSGAYSPTVESKPHGRISASRQLAPSEAVLWLQFSGMPFYVQVDPTAFVNRSRLSGSNPGRT
jgi:hypothetical protein